MHKHDGQICPICKETFAKSVENVKRDEESAQKLQKSVNNLNKCPNCESEFDGLWAVGWREGVLERLVEEYKYQSVWVIGPVLAELLDSVLPKDLEVVVVPLPTIGKHVRERGLDHTWRVGRKLARRRGWKCERLLSRAADTVQVGANVVKRKKQAARAYTIAGEARPDRSYLLLDDVWTTGATMLAAEKVLRAAGAERIYGAVVAVST